MVSTTAFLAKFMPALVYWCVFCHLSAMSHMYCEVPVRPKIIDFSETANTLTIYFK